MEIGGLFKQQINKIREINQKYAKPRVKMTRGVRFALIMLRLYLILLVGILVFKFITMVNK